MQDLNQTIEQLFSYLKGIWIKKRYIIISTWLLCPLGWAYVVSMPDEYKASARVYADTRNMLQPLLRGLAITSNPDQELRLIARTLFSRDNLEDIAREADLDLKAQNQTEFDVIVDELKQNLKISSARRENTFTISYSNRSPEQAFKIVQITLDRFVESTLGNKRENTDVAEAFLDQQIAEYESRLAKAEQRLADFKRKQMKVIPESSNYYNLLKSEKRKLDEARLALRELESSYAAAKDRLSSEVPSVNENSAFARSSIPTQYDDRIASLQQKLDDLLIRFTDAHPEVKETSAMLTKLSLQRDEEVKQVLASIDTGEDRLDTQSSSMSPVYQEMKINVTNIESQIASLKVRVEAYQNNVAELEGKLNLVPTMEAELTALNRDYGITKQKYEQLLQRKESARLSRMAGTSTDDVKFRVLEPAKLPKKPDGPNRLALYSGVLIVGFGAGIAIAFLLSQLTPVVLRAGQLNGITQLPVFGVVSHTDVDIMKKKLRKKYWVFGASCAVIIFVYASLMFVEITFGGLPTELIGKYL